MKKVTFAFDQWCKSITQADFQHINLIFASEESLPNTLNGVSLNIDKNKMTLVIRNFVSNALKFTPKGGEIRVKVQYDAELFFSDGSSEGTVRIEVHDTGCGISAVS